MEMLVVISAGLSVGAAIEVAVTVSKVVINWTRCMLRRLQTIHLVLTVIITGAILTGALYTLSESTIHEMCRTLARLRDDCQEACYLHGTTHLVSSTVWEYMAYRIDESISLQFWVAKTRMFMVHGFLRHCALCR
jgi:hypothetical protein